MIHSYQLVRKISQTWGWSPSCSRHHNALSTALLIQRQAGKRWGWFIPLWLVVVILWQAVLSVSCKSVTQGKVICLDFVQADQPGRWTVLGCWCVPKWWTLSWLSVATRAKRSKSGGHPHCEGMPQPGGRKTQREELLVVLFTFMFHLTVILPSASCGGCLESACGRKSNNL